MLIKSNVSLKVGVEKFSYVFIVYGKIFDLGYDWLIYGWIYCLVYYFFCLLD